MVPVERRGNSKARVLKTEEYTRVGEEVGLYALYWIVMSSRKKGNRRREGIYTVILALKVYRISPRITRQGSKDAGAGRRTQHPCPAVHYR
jgi:hypothetical protein